MKKRWYACSVVLNVFDKIKWMKTVNVYAWFSCPKKLSNLFFFVKPSGFFLSMYLSIFFFHFLNQKLYSLLALRNHLLYWSFFVGYFRPIKEVFAKAQPTVKWIVACFFYKPRIFSRWARNRFKIEHNPL